MKGPQTVKEFTYDSARRTTAVETSAGTSSLTYDYESRVTGITYPNQSTNSFTYNGLDTRVGMSDSGGSKTFLRDGVSVTSPVLSDGSATYTPAISERRSSTTTFYHAGIKNGDSQSSTGQSVTASVQYDAFDNLGWVGHLLDDLLRRLDPLLELDMPVVHENRQIQAQALLGVEDLVVPEQRDRDLLRFLLFVLLLDLEPFPEDRDRGVLALPNVAAEFVGLPERQPAVVGVWREREKQKVDAVVRPHADGVAGQLVASPPRLAPRHDSGLERLDDAVGDDVVRGSGLGFETAGMSPARPS